MRKLLAALSIGLLSFTMQAKAENTDLQLSLTPDVALHDKDTFITGLSLNIWGENPQNFASIGFINGSSNRSQSRFAASSSYSSGFSFGLVNYTEAYKGLHIGFDNTSSVKFTGAQIGFINQANAVSGTQIGLVNYCKYMNRGIQIGLINVNAKDNNIEDVDTGAVIMPLVNWSF